MRHTSLRNRLPEETPVDKREVRRIRAGLNYTWAMSYVVSIVRQDASNRRIPIPRDEWRALVEADPGLRIESDTEKCLLVEWVRPDGNERTFLSYHDGVIDGFSPDDPTLEKMQKIARAMNSTVLGEDGECLMDDYVPRGGCLSILLFAALGLRHLLLRLQS